MTPCRRTFLATSLLSFLLPKAVLGRNGTGGAEGIVIKRRYVDGPFGQIHVRIASPADLSVVRNPPLACFHYSPGSGRLFDPLLPYLAHDRMVMAFDTPGYGFSDPPSQQPYIDDYAEALSSAVGLIAGEQQVDVFGQLTGSLIAVEMAVSRPDLVRKVVLSRSPVFTEETRVNGVAEMLKRHAERKKDMSAQYLVDRLKRGLGSLGPNDPPERYLGAFIDSALPGHNWVYGEVAAFSYRADINMPKLTQPVLFITWFEDDAEEGGDFGSMTEWTRGAAIIPNVTPLNVKGLGRWPWQDHPDVISSHVLKFLDEA